MISIFCFLRHGMASLKEIKKRNVCSKRVFLYFIIWYFINSANEGIKTLLKIEFLTECFYNLTTF